MRPATSDSRGVTSATIHFLEKAFHTYTAFLRARLLMTRDRPIIAR
jgi:hypothetical protein